MLVVIHPDFKGEALSWTGADLALLKLSSWTMKEVKDSIVPICLLVRTKTTKDMAGTLFVAGYGRRTLPHCVTNDFGPEKFGICGRHKDCTKLHRARQYGLGFFYKGKMHKNCIHLVLMIQNAKNFCKVCLGPSF